MATTHQLFENNAESTVNGTIAVGAGFFNVAAGHGSRFPTPGAGQYFVITVFERDASGVEINFEMMKVTSTVGDTLTVLRDFEGAVVSAGGTSGGWAFPSAPGINPSQIVYVQLRYTAYAANNNLTKDGNLEGLESAATARENLGLENVNNTSDALKPASDPQKAAFVAKTSDTGAFHTPTGTSAQRPPAPLYGDERTNTDLNAKEWWNGTAWVPLGGGQMLGQSLVKAISFNAQVISEDLVIPANVNGFSVGPVQIAPGFSVSYEPGATWKII